MQTTATARFTRAGWLVWLAGMLLTAPVVALGPPDGGGDQPVGAPPVALQPEAPDKDRASDTGNAPRRRQNPAAPPPSTDSFTPSERINADSAVSFPVDI
jgi:hypothetical protein